MIAATLPAAAFGTNTDAVLEHAWARRQEAYAAYNALPDEEWERGAGYAPEQDRLWVIIDEAEEVIRSTVAKTPRGAAIQLWVALYHSVTGREDDEAITRGDLVRLSKIEDGFDWSARMALAALRSLEAMGA